MREKCEVLQLRTVPTDVRLSILEMNSLKEKEMKKSKAKSI